MKSSTIIFCLLLAGACSKVKELDKRTESMEKSTEKVSTTTDEMKKTTDTMYQQIRSKEAEATREAKFQVLLDKDADIGAKMTAASVYFKSMEFQLWSNNDSFDNKKSRETMFLEAGQEFAKRIIDIYDQIDVNKISPTKNDKMANAFYSVAATMHFNHAYQEELAGHKKVKLVSFYDLMKRALLKDSVGERLEDYEEILVNGQTREISIELIKARVDIMSALALANLTDKRKMTLTQKAKALLFKISNGHLGTIDLPEIYGDSNSTTKLFTQRYLDGAIKAKKFLEKIGVEKKLDKTLTSALKNIDFNADENVQEEEFNKSSDSEKASIQGMINTLLE